MTFSQDEQINKKKTQGTFELPIKDDEHTKKKQGMVEESTKNEPSNDSYQYADDNVEQLTRLVQAAWIADDQAKCWDVVKWSTKHIRAVARQCRTDGYPDLSKFLLNQWREQLDNGPHFYERFVSSSRRGRQQVFLHHHHRMCKMERIQQAAVTIEQVFPDQDKIQEALRGIWPHADGPELLPLLPPMMRPAVAGMLLATGTEWNPYYLQQQQRQQRDAHRSLDPLEPLPAPATAAAAANWWECWGRRPRPRRY